MDEGLMRAVIADVSLGRGVDESYTAEMKAFRASVERDWAKWKSDHPKAVLAVPNGIDGLP
jgi:hypothetical protein